MSTGLRRRDVVRAGLATATATIAGCLGSPGGSASGAGGDRGGADQSIGWRTATLTDVRTDETFVIDDFSRPVLLETFAVWCSTCLRQQRQIQAFHDQVGDDVISVSLNVDPNEDASKVVAHTERHGFDWRYAVSPPGVTNSLVEDFGRSITVPPRAPMVLICPEGGARRLDDGVKSVEALRAAVSTGC